MIEEILYNKSVFEVVRDKVVYILLTELTNQLALAVSEVNVEYEDYLKKFFKDDALNVYAERFNRPDVSELNCINIYFDRLFLPTGSQATLQRAKLRIVTDVMVFSKGVSGSRGDELSNKDMQKMLGIVRNILMHTQYVRLGFSPGLISKRWIGNLDGYRPNEPENRVNVDNLTTGSVFLDVEFDEKNLYDATEELEINYTNINIDENGKYTIETSDLNLQ